MKKIFTFLIAAGLSSMGISQVLDQSNTASTGSGWLVNSGPYLSSGQSFTCGITGDLNSVVISIDADNPVYPLIAGDFVLNIRSGSGFGGTIVGSETFTITGTETTGDFTINISSTISLVSGNVYTYEIDETSGTGQLMLSASSDTYPGGILYNNTGTPSGYSGYDYKFKTYMDEACIIADQTVSTTDSELCLTNSGTTITTGSSEAGVYYYLRDDANDTIVDGPILGTGSGLSFNTGDLANSMDYNVYAFSPKNVTALTMDGINEYVTTPNVVQDNSWTYETWVKPNDFSVDWSGIITSNSGVGTGTWFQLSLEASGQLKWESYSPNLTINNIGPNINDNMWHHVAATCDGVNITIYVDGTQVAQQAYAGGTMDRPLHIMAERVPTEYVAGQVDETMVWDYARSSTEILADMTACLDGSEPGLLVYYDYEDGIGSSVTDLAGGDHNGTLMNMEDTDWTNSTDFAFNCADCVLEMTNVVSVTVQDTTAPAPDNATLADVTEVCSVTSLTEPTATDNCSATVTVTNDATLPITAIGTTVVTWSYEDENGNISTQTQNVIVSAPTIDITTNTVGLTISANNTSATAYQWLDCNTNTPITGETNASFTATNNGDYAVIVSEGSCSDTSLCVNIADVGIDAATWENDLVQVYPNPNNGEFYISTTAADILLTIYSADGKVIVNNLKITQATQLINLGKVENGVYFVKVKNETNQKTIRLIIE